MAVRRVLLKGFSYGSILFDPWVMSIEIRDIYQNHFVYAKWVFEPKHSDMLIVSYISKTFVINAQKLYLHEVYFTSSFKIIITLT